MLDDGPLVEKARRGDENAWRQLYERHADLVFRLVLRKVGEREAALDIVQEAYVRASGAIDGFRGDASFRSWIARIALNEAHSWLRRRARRKEVPLEALPARRDRSRPVDEAVARSDLAERALAFALQLPDQQRDAVILRTTEGLPYREIARMIGTTEGSVRVSYHHGMAKLREYLTGLDASESGAASAEPEEERAGGGHAG